MRAKNFVIGLLVLILLGGILTAIYHLSGGLGNSVPTSLIHQLSQLAF